MALVINRPQERTSGVRAEQRYFFNADRSALVNEDDPDAAFLACAPGDDLPEGLEPPKAAKSKKGKDE